MAHGRGERPCLFLDAVLFIGMSDDVHHLLCNTFANTVLAFRVSQMTDYLIRLDTILALATYGNSPLLVANEILVGNGGFWGFTHTERGYMFHTTPMAVLVEHCL